MRNLFWAIPRLAAAGLVAACVAPSLGPTTGPVIQVTPGPGKSYAQFRADDANCRAAANYPGAPQAQLDNVYAQCMIAQGNQIPAYPYAAANQPRPPVAALPPADPLVSAIQVELSRNGYLAARPDGILGPTTTAAIRAYQQTHNMPPDGAPSPYLLDMLRANHTQY